MINAKLWIRIIENSDFITISQKRLTVQGNETTYIDHVVKLDMAKEEYENLEEFTGW